MTSTGHAERVQQVTRLARQGERSELCDGVSEGKEEGGKREKSGGNEKGGAVALLRARHTPGQVASGGASAASDKAGEEWWRLWRERERRGKQRGEERGKRCASGVMTVNTY